MKCLLRWQTSDVYLHAEQSFDYIKFYNLGLHTFHKIATILCYMFLNNAVNQTVFCDNILEKKLWLSKMSNLHHQYPCYPNYSLLYVLPSLYLSVLFLSGT